MATQRGPAPFIWIEIMTTLSPFEHARSQPFDFLPLPALRSAQKPRRRGLTMMIDQGLPCAYIEDLVATVGDYIDFTKIKSGTARLYPRSVLQRKIEIYKANNIMPFIGGQFHEYVLATEGAKATAQFYDEAKRLGFAAIEISDNVVPLTDRERRDHIRAACDSGLVVFGEVGGKDRRSEPEELLSQARICLAAGARLVLVEAAELLVEGRPDRQMLGAIYRGLDPEQVMIELPGPWIPGVRSCDIEVLKKLLVTEFGPDVNIANVSFDTVLDLEATRNGLGVAGPFSSQQLREWAK
jgi:phosphosulfolactate synthase